MLELWWLSKKEKLSNGRLATLLEGAGLAFDIQNVQNFKNQVL